MALEHTGPSIAKFVPLQSSQNLLEVQEVCHNTKSEISYQ